MSMFSGSSMRTRGVLCALTFLLLLQAGVAVAQTAGAALTREQAVQALERPAAAERAAGIARLAEVGEMRDADLVVARLGDDDEAVRDLAGAAVWRIWSRSGDAQVDALFRRGLAQMEARELIDALATYSEIVRRKPEFAEGWNKRATVLFLLGRHEASLRDCDEVLRRNPNHFGALSGAGQIHLQLGDAASALDFFERALKVNPNLAGTEAMVRVLREQLGARRRQSI